MTRYLNKSQNVARVLLVLSFLALVDKRSDALLLGNLIGCGSLGCRLTALESDVAQLKQQVNRLEHPHTNHGMHSNYRPVNNPYGQMNPLSNMLNQGANGASGMNGSGGASNQQQGQQVQPTQPGANTSSTPPRVNAFSNLMPEYPLNQQQVRRNNDNSYENGLQNEYYRRALM